jgi:citrate synthase
MTKSPIWLSASAAAERLGITRTTLYAYVSRGYIRSQVIAGRTRERGYAAEDVERLRRRTEERRAPDKAAARTLDWGLPILESAITLIDGRTLYYRGHDVMRLARTRPLEDVAALIWTGRLEPLPRSLAAPLLESRLPALRGLPFIAAARSLLAVAAVRDPRAVDLRPSGVVRTGSAILNLLTHAAIGREPGNAGLHTALIKHWRAGAAAADVVRAALVLCADHELNVSSFTARCVASAGSHPYAVVSAGLSALEGPKHGGAGARVDAMLGSIPRGRGLARGIEARQRRGEPIEGFGHPLYAEGDPRARLLLDLLAERWSRSPEYRFIADFVRAAHDAIGERPNVDFALAAAARVLDLPASAPLMLFAIARSVGWIGHAMEQYATHQLIRPRARYTGVTPPEVPGDV